MSALATIITSHSGTQTGPRTDSGKEISSQNATRHGGASRKLMVPGEDPAEFHALLNGLVDEYCPDSVQSRTFVENLAEAHWLLARRCRAHNAIEAAVYGEQPDAADWTEKHLKRLALADRYKTQAERSLKRALNNIEGWRKWSRGETDRKRRTEQWEAAHAVRERRISLQEEKFAAAQSREANKAIRSAKNAVSSPQAAITEHHTASTVQALSSPKALTATVPSVEIVENCDGSRQDGRLIA